MLGVQATAKEIKALRDWNRRCFENADGSRTYIVRSGRWHTKVQGQWLDKAEVQALGLMLPMADYYGETPDGEISGNSAANYASARSGSDTVADTRTTARVGQDLDGGTFYCRRAFISFDTSGIEDEYGVTAATLYLKAASDSSTTDFLVRVYRYAWTEALGGANQEANYDGAYGVDATLEGTFRDTSGGWVAGTYYSMSVTPSGISKTGDTKYSVVSKEDVDNSEPAGAEYVSFYTADAASTTSDPYLAITVVPPGMAMMF